MCMDSFTVNNISVLMRYVCEKLVLYKKLSDASFSDSKIKLTLPSSGLVYDLQEKRNILIRVGRLPQIVMY